MIPTAVIVTRGDVILDPVLASLPENWPVCVYDNSDREDFKVYGHFKALEELDCEYVYMQDDDAICPAAYLLGAWTPDDTDRVLLNEADGETPWISWGGIFRRDLPDFTPYTDAFGVDDDLLLWCDLVFTMLHPWRNVELGRQSLPHAYADNRMWRNPEHYAEQARVRGKVNELLVAA